MTEGGTKKRAEILIVIFIGGVLAALVGGSLFGLQGRLAVHLAQSRFLALHGESRELAAERGVPMRFVADPATQTVQIEEGCSGAGRVLASRDFNLSYRVDMRIGGGELALCITPQGVPDPGSSSLDEPGQVTFLRGAYASSVALSSLGQPGER